MKIILLTLLCAVSLNISANELSRLSVGASAGGINYNSGRNDPSAEDSSSTFSLVGQYNISSVLGIEGTISNFGSYKSNSVTTEFSGLTLSVVGKTRKYHDLNAYGKAGMAILTMNQRIDFLGSEIENRSTGDALVASAGISYSPSFIKRLSLRMSYDYIYFRTTNITTGNEIDNNFSSVSVGLMLDI